MECYALSLEGDHGNNSSFTEPGRRVSDELLFIDACGERFT